MKFSKKMLTQEEMLVELEQIFSCSLRDYKEVHDRLLQTHECYYVCNNSMKHEYIIVSRFFMNKRTNRWVFDFSRYSNFEFRHERFLAQVIEDKRIRDIWLSVNDRNGIL